MSAETQPPLDGSGPGDPHAPHDPEALDEDRVRVLRLGPSANCSSVGSSVDLLFAAAAVGSVALVAVLAALRAERVEAPAASEPPRDDGQGEP